MQTIYFWRGIDRQGRYRHGRVYAASSHILSARLTHIGIGPVRVCLSWYMIISWRWWAQQLRLMRGRRVLSYLHVELVCRHIGALIAADVPVHQALLLVSKSVPAAHEVLTVMARMVADGNELGAAFLNTASWWPPLLVAVVRTSDGVGSLAAVLQELAEGLSVQRSYRQKVWGAVSGPLITLCLSAAVLGFMATVIMPQIAAASGVALPPLCSAWFSEGILAVLVSVLVFGILFTRFFPLYAHRIYYMVPFWGSLCSYRDAVILVRLLPILVRAGMPLINALRVLAVVPGNHYWQKCMQRVCQQLARGSSLRAVWHAAWGRVMPLLVGHAFSVAPHTSSLIGICRHLETVLAHHIVLRMHVLTALLQPLILLCIGGGVMLLLQPFLEVVIGAMVIEGP